MTDTWRQGQKQDTISQRQQQQEEGIQEKSHVDCRWQGLRAAVPKFTGVHIMIPHVPDVGHGSMGFSVPIATL